MTPLLQHRTELYRQRIEQVLSRCLPLPHTSSAPPLAEAMRYATLGGGKRVRALLVYLTGELWGTPLDLLDGAAAAVELIHAYSLVHDDLPAMDDDDLRRGQPSCHKAFGEATAILAGDALQCAAFTVVAADPVLSGYPQRIVALLARLSRAAGHDGMVAGQMLDMVAEGRSLTLAELQQIHRLKTGALIRAAVALGYLCGEPPDAAVVADLERYGEAIGLAFQIRDDILDLTGDTATLGKAIGSDLAAVKSTYPALLGLEGAQQAAQQAHQQAVAALARFDDRADPLRQLADYIVARIC